MLDVIVSEYGEGYRLESKEEASEESKWRETRVRGKIAGILGGEYEPLNIQLFPERLSEKVHATIPKGIVDGFEFTVPQRIRSLKE